jgi:hypothetical protein
MSTLDHIRQLAQEARTAEEDKVKRHAELLARFSANVQPSLEKVFSFLVEMEEHLNYLKPEILVDYSVPGFGELKGLRQGDYRMPKGRKDLLERVVFSFSCSSEGEVIRKTDDNRRLSSVVERLDEYGLSYDVRKVIDENKRPQGGKIILQRTVPVTISFSGSLNDTTIELGIKNYFGFKNLKSTLQPDEISDQFIDELGKFILREENSLMTVRLTKEQRQHVSRLVEEDKAEKARRLKEIEAAAAAEEAERLRELEETRANSRFASLFPRK